MEPDFDVIVVGGGIAGCITAQLLAAQGHSVVVIERGDNAGAKNLSGGICYSRILAQVFPDYLAEAPYERQIVRNVFGLVGKERATFAEVFDPSLAQPVNAISVLRAPFDAWLAEQAEAAGAFMMPGVRVDELLMESGRVIGVRAGEDELRAQVVVAADGINSFLARAAGLRSTPSLNHLAVGVKAVIGLDSQVIADRFHLEGREGAAFALVGDVTAGVGGGAFLYTNRQSLSFGVVLRLDDLTASGKESAAIFDHALSHKALAPLLRDGEIIEYGCHLTGEGGIHLLDKIHFDGLVVVGDAAGLTINTGLTIRGMDFAIGSAIAAAEGIHTALTAGDTSAVGLSHYRRAFEASYLYADLKTYAKAPAFLEQATDMYDRYPELVGDVFHRIYAIDGDPRTRLLASARAAFKDSAIKFRQLLRDGLSAVRSL